MGEFSADSSFHSLFLSLSVLCP